MLNPPEELWLEACKIKRMSLGWAYYERLWIEDEEEVTQYRVEPETPGKDKEVLQNPFM